ncbi:VanZ family protein [Allokutzneria sp. A3M-2-11 16]|uniref:VanZ family protein n=1 Tax=Allokutzneria sp. A3M-2-11 16 TaxID=2962043 RepID=UPI0020B73488|nr:VanZ family protein [Allokutzneria sp. A3M-2-11 16]MCP3799198.1 VanZ family protein [Allokutzneria sp. A3M-2-11 16]
MRHLNRDLDLFERIFGNPKVAMAALVGCLVLGVVGLVLGRLMGWRKIASGLSLASLGGVLAATLVRSGNRYGADTLGEVWAMCRHNDFSLTGSWARLNFVMLMPFAFFGVLAVRRFIPVAVACVGLAIGIELYQGLSGLGACETQDMINNALGGLLAAGIAWLLTGKDRWSGRRHRTTTPPESPQHWASIST